VIARSAIDWGDVPAWTGGVIAVLAVVLSAWALIRSSRQARDAIATQTRALHAQTFLFYLERMEDVREDRAVLRHIIGKVKAGDREALTITSARSDDDEHPAAINWKTAFEISQCEGSAGHRWRRWPRRPSQFGAVWFAADRIARAYDLLAVAYATNIVDRDAVDRMYLPMLWVFWQDWLQDFVVFEQQKRGEDHFWELQNLATHSAEQAWSNHPRRATARG
jgi:hypothetical protein